MSEKKLADHASNLVGYIGNLQTVTSFLDGGQLTEFIGAVGHVNLEAAETELAMLNSSKNKRDTVNRAATMLRLALSAFTTTIRKSRAIKIGADPKKHGNDIEVGFIAAKMALVTCYIYLEEWSLAKSTLSLESPSFDLDLISLIDVPLGLGLILVNPKSWVNVMSGKYDELAQMQEKCKKFEEKSLLLINNHLEK